jgi:calcium homeostasis ER protein
MELPKPPDDLELKNIIDKLANFVARNGPEFEHMTKQKQQNNPKFQFLFSGEHFNYYQYRVTTEQAVLKVQQQKQQQMLQQTMAQQSIRAAPWQQQAAPPQQQQQQLAEQLEQMRQQLEQQRHTSMDQIKQSETNLAAQYQSIMQQQQVTIDEAVCSARKEQLIALSNECQISVDELNAITQPIIDSCTKEAISNGKNWIFTHNTSQHHGDLVAHYLLDRVSAKDATFEVRLHLIYLVNDILHHCVRRNADDLRKSLETVVVPLFCISHIGVDKDKQNKLVKLLSLWETNGYFDQSTVESMKNPFNAMASYQADLLATHSGIVTQISQEMNGRYMALQKQHQDFAAHHNNQIATLEQQVHLLQQQGTYLGTQHHYGLSIE